MSNEKKNDGGPAFSGTRVVPRPYRHDDVASNYIEQPYGGNVSMRDYFAAKAMQGIMSQPDGAIHESERDGSFDEWQAKELFVYAKSAYAMADAMLKAREE